MKKRLSLLLAALLTLTLVLGAFCSVASAATDYSNVRVLLSTGSVSTLTMSVPGNYFIQENGASFSNGTLTISSSGGQLVASHSSAGQLYSGSTINVMRESITPSAGSVKVPTIYGSRSYLGHFTFIYNGGYIRCVNTVPMAHYLYGVVAYEMSNTFPVEALKAQAVAAKCYVLACMAPTSTYDIGDTSTDQVYKGYTASYTNVINAVDATYDIGLYLSGRILCAYYAASNGGSTILPSDAWAGTNRYQWDAAFSRTSDPYDLRNPESVQETATFPYNGESGGMSTALTNYLRSKAYAVLSASGYLPSGGTVASVDAVNDISQTATNYADVTLTVTMLDSAGTPSQLTFSYNFHLGELLSNGVFSKSQSLRLYTVVNTGSAFTVIRGRYGHGVGLSQRGAQQMGKEGMGYQQILRFYYPGASLSSMGLAAPTDPAKPTVEAVVPGASTAIGTVKTTGSVNMRSGPSTGYEKITKLSKNKTLTLYQQSDGWSLCGNEKYTGWVSNEYLKVTYADSTNELLPAANAAAESNVVKSVTAYGSVTSNTLNFRASPGNGKVLQKLKKNAALNIYGTVENGSWYYCQYDGVDGYVSASYVTLTATAPQQNTTATPQTDAQTTQPEANLPIVDPTPAATTTSAWSGTVVNEFVRFRSTPDFSTQSNIIGSYEVGSQLIVYAQSGDFYKVSPDGGVTVGYMHKDYVQVGSAISVSSPAALTSAVNTTSSVNVGATTANVYLRQKASSSGKVLTTLKKGAQIVILGESGSYYQVQSGDKTGYIVKKYANITGTAAAPSSNSAVVSDVSTFGSAGTTTGKVRLRSSATTKSSSNVLTTIPRGATVTIISKESNWYYCSYNGSTGYVYANYVKAN
ncbi:MAG: SH3 domain-containing protein [Eubacteriales bacterium]|nr:SH3 domain-containing protein [Eubacteriales bacterium]